MVPDFFIWVIFGVVGAVSVAWIVLGTYAAQGVGQNTAGKVVIALILVPAPFIYFGFQIWHDKYKWKHAENLERELVAKTLHHLERVCEAEENFKVYLPFERNAGVFYKSSWEDDKHLDFGSPWLADLPTPKSGFQAWWEERKQWWYGDLFSPSRVDQYLYPVKWRHSLRGHTIVSVLGGGSFVEYGSGSSVYAGTGFMFNRIATRDWWKKDGWDVHVKKIIPHMSEPNPREEYIQYPVSDLKAKYELFIEDVSVVEDRRNWLSRIRLRLVERRTSDVVAEYLGFAANVSPMKKGHESPWSLIRACPKAVQGTDTAGYEQWDAGRFFFSKLVGAL